MIGCPVRGCCYDVIVLNVRVPAEDKCDTKDRFCEELEHELRQFCKYHVEILFGDFNAWTGREDIYKPTFGNENVHKTGHGNRVKSTIWRL
jgi:exonuclease III